MKERSLMIDNLDGYQFEELVAKIMKRRGYHILSIAKSRDIGKDILMDAPNGDRIVVECKHQKFVGRPVVMKLQGAIDHEETLHPNKEVKGILVTSGRFSNEALQHIKEIGKEIELIDGKDLKKICKELGVHIFNGKIQIVINKSFPNVTDIESKDLSLNTYSQIYGSKLNKAMVKTELEFYPACYIEYGVSFDTYTSVGCVDEYSNSDSVILDGKNGNYLPENLQSFFFSGHISEEEINDKHQADKIPFEFTENDIEDQVVMQIIKEHTHDVSYTGQNNVTYTKTCAPSKSDIDINKFIPIYLPFWINNITIKNMKYIQKLYVRESKKLYVHDELKICKICSSHRDEYSKMSVCLECGRIVCKNHIKIDYLDKKTPSCNIHARPLRLYLQNKYFAYKDNLTKYKNWWQSQGFWVKVWEDKIVSGLSIGGVFLLLIYIISLIK